MASETTTTDVGHRALEALRQDTQTAAGARALIRRALARTGFTATSGGAADADSLASWALRNPELIGPSVASMFERAAQEWTEGNNSGSEWKLSVMERRCEETRKQAALVCGLFGIERVDFPGLYPTFHRAGRTWYSGDEIRALKGE